MILGTNGEILAASKAIVPERHSIPALVGDATGASTLRTLMHTDGQVLEMVSVPIRTRTGDAWVSTGLQINQQLAERTSALTGLDITLIENGSARRVLASSITDIDEGRLLDGVGLSGMAMLEPATVASGNGEILATAMPLIPGLPDVEVLLSEPVDSIMAPYHSLRVTVLQLSALALALAVLGGILLSRTIIRPLQQLVTAARRISDGDYHQPIHVAARGEVAELTMALNVMRENIAEREAHISWQARFDTLTGLPSRLAGIEALGEALTLAREHDMPLSVMVIDLNRISELGSSLGNDISGSLLSQAAERLRAGLDTQHVLTRLDGDQFMAILRNRHAEDAVAIGEDLLRLLDAGLSVHGVQVGCEVVIGLAAFPQHGDEAELLLQRAAVARNEASHRRNVIQVYQPGNEARQVRQLTILADLRRAARHDELRLYLQPKLRLADGRICGAEALVRWQHPTLGFLSPNEFIPIAEQSGNISLVTSWALTAAVRECRLLQEEGLELPISVNLSGQDLRNPRLPTLILDLLRDHDLAPRFLILEITEAAVVDDPENATRMLDHLRNLGIRISVDDFGTGYSSLAQLKHLPVDEMKLDRAFIMALPEDRNDMAIVRASIRLAHEMGIEVVAEGVENPAALAWLKDQGCERAQGYLISKPMPADVFGRWVTDYDREHTQPLVVIQALS